MENFDTIAQKMTKRSGKFATIQVDPSVVGEFKEACESMPLSPSMSRVATGLVRWFSAQPEFVKTSVVAGIDSGLNSAYAKLLDELARQVRSGQRPEDPRFDWFRMLPRPNGRDGLSKPPAGTSPKPSREDARASRAKAK